ncbi:MAG: DEAD/DEAH box helicase family protein [Rubrivivax sp.]
MSFAEVSLRRHYDSDDVDVLQSFYRPVLGSAVRYDRAVGYFSSTTLRACARELAAFVGKSGTIRLVIGCLISQADVEALSAMGVSEDDAQRQVLRDQLKQELLALEENDLPAAVVLSKCVASGVAQLKFAVRSPGIYHEKFGIFYDEYENRISFIGSANETQAALSFGINHESFQVYQSLEPVLYEAYGQELEVRFADLWMGKAKKTRIFDLDEESLELMRQTAAKVVSHGMEEEERLPRLLEKFQLRRYQTKALDKWAANTYHGILAMATGTGKTMTAIDAVKRFRAKVAGGPVVITVPYQNLAVQWIEALRDQGIETVAVFASHATWYENVKNRVLAAQLSDAIEMPVLVCVNDTFKDARFQALLHEMKASAARHRMLVVDECHHFNSPEHIRKLPEHFNFRLGLSATPYDQFAEHYLDAYFGQIVYEFPLGQAIGQGFLTPYRYHVHVVGLDSHETEQYDELTKKIVSVAGIEERMTPETLAIVQPWLLKRSRLVGAAQEKLPMLETLLTNSGRSDFNLFYCGDGRFEDVDGTDGRQVDLVVKLLHRLGWKTSRVTAEESLKVREAILESLRRTTVNAVVSIKVLDEGIDIPDCRTAYLLASQSSDRQGIQRRGRVLRRADGKSIADLHDFLVLNAQNERGYIKGLAVKELRRARQFAADASNGTEVIAELDRLALERDIKVGVEIGN